MRCSSNHHTTSFSQISKTDALAKCKFALSEIDRKRQARIDAELEEIMQQDQRSLWDRIWRRPKTYLTKAEAMEWLQATGDGIISEYQWIQMIYEDDEAELGKLLRLAENCTDSVYISGDDMALLVYWGKK